MRVAERFKKERIREELHGPRWLRDAVNPPWLMSWLKRLLPPRKPRGRPTHSLESRLRLVAPYVAANPDITQEMLAELLSKDDPEARLTVRTIRNWHNKHGLNFEEFKSLACQFSFRFSTCCDHECAATLGSIDLEECASADQTPPRPNDPRSAYRGECSGIASARPASRGESTPWTGYLGRAQ